jgi:hypothetical protein
MIFFEHKSEALLPLPAFFARLMRNGILAGAIILVALLIGVAGYHWLGPLPWLDALVNASMILGGMGPVDPIHTVAGKWFESIYALFSGVAFLTSAGVFFAPLLHRLMHRFHLEESG